MRELDQGFGRWLDWKRDTVAQRPVRSAAVSGQSRANICTPEHDGDGIDEQREGSFREPVGGAHAGTMESNLGRVNDGKSERMALVVALIIHD